jgi:hypothetical protein
MEPEAILRTVQIVFYASATAIAWLTYRSAKRGFLSSVNTEYQRPVIDRLQQLSQELWHDFEIHSDGFVGRLTDEICRSIEIRRVSGDETGRPVQARSVLVEATTLYQSLTTDPFIPPALRRKIYPYLQHRVFIGEVVADEFAQKAADWSEPSRDMRVVRTHVTERLDALSAARSARFAHRSSARRDLYKIIGFRDAIREHLESFDPLRRRRLFGSST